jgi:uncharacterized protein (TIGR02598 family)
MRGFLAVSRGFSLVEVTLAIGVAAFVLIIVLGMLGAGVTMSGDVIENSAATALIESIAGDIRAAEHAGLAATSVHKLPLDGSGASQRIEYEGRAFLVTLVSSPPSPGGSALKSHRLSARWPAEAPGEQARGFIELPILIYNEP